MVNVTPAGITPGDANRGSVVHASDASLGDLSRSHTEEDISRLQSAINDYSSSLTYNIGDVVLESGSVFRCTTDITVPEAFNAANWNNISQNAPWIIDQDANQFKLFNIPLIEMDNDGTVNLEMRRTTNPGVTGNSAIINFRAGRDTGGNIVWGSIRNVIIDVSAGTASAEIQFQARQADSLTVFMTINEGNADHIRFFRTVNVHQTNLTFDTSLSPPGGGAQAIYTTSAAMIFNMPSSRGFSWTVNNVQWMEIDPTVGIEIATITSQQVGFYGTTPVAQQSVGVDDLASLYAAIRALGLIA